MGKRRRLIAWWLGSRDELCSSCGHPYAHGTGLRCADCDADLCALCAERREQEIACPTCPPPEKTASGRRGVRWRRARSGKA